MSEDKRTRVARDEFETFADGEDAESLPTQTRESVARDKGLELYEYVTTKSKTGTASNGKVYATKDEAEKVGKAFQRVLNVGIEAAGKADGFSARLVILPAGTGWKFNVLMGPAREGKGTPRGPHKNGKSVQVQAPSPENAAAMAAEDARKVAATGKR